MVSRTIRSGPSGVCPLNRALSYLLAGLVVAIAAANVSFYLKVGAGNSSGNEPWSLDRMNYVAWNGERWTAWIHDGKFELVPEDQENWSRHAKSGIAFVNWDGEPWQARGYGATFLLAAEGNWDGEIVRDEAIRYLDWSGNRRLRTVANLQR